MTFDMNAGDTFYDKAVDNKWCWDWVSKTCVHVEGRNPYLKKKKKRIAFQAAKSRG